MNPTIDTEEEGTEEEVTSTFAVDVDTASYTVARSYLNRGHLPEEEAVRVEEFVNSFDYTYQPPEEDSFSVQAGDFNSYSREDSVRVLEQAGYRNLVADHLPTQSRYTFVFHGEAGMLEYIFASPSLAGRITGAGGLAHQCLRTAVPVLRRLRRTRGTRPE